MVKKEVKKLSSREKKILSDMLDDEELLLDDNSNKDYNKKSDKLANTNNNSKKTDSNSRKTDDNSKKAISKPKNAVNNRDNINKKTDNDDNNNKPTKKNKKTSKISKTKIVKEEKLIFDLINEAEKHYSNKDEKEIKKLLNKNLHSDFIKKPIEHQAKHKPLELHEKKNELKQKFFGDNEKGVEVVINQKPIQKKKVDIFDDDDDDSKIETELIKPNESISESVADILRIGRQGDVSHSHALQKALDNYPKIHKNQIIKRSIIAILLGIIFALILINSGFFEFNNTLNTPNNPRIPEHKVVLVYENTTKQIPINISYNEYIQNPNQYDKKQLSLIGFLENKITLDPTANIYRYYYYIRDDSGNQIKLKKLDPAYKNLFIEDSITNELYNISGKFLKVYSGVSIEPDSFNQIDRPKKTITETVAIEKTIQVQPNS